MRDITFIDENGSFLLRQPENTSYLYFPLASVTGLKSAVTPSLGGDAKIDQETFLLEPVSAENLHNNRSTRNFWFIKNGTDAYSVSGSSAEQENARFSAMQDESELTAGFMWQTLKRSSKTLKISTAATSFIPKDGNVEILYVTVKNQSESIQKLNACAAIPIYGRSADNIRDHRNVTSMLHRIDTIENGVLVCPTMSFDEKGHRENTQIYYALGCTGDGRMPEEKVLLEYILREIAYEKDLTGKKILVTAGATREPIDPVRFITNHSSGKMGFALARAAMLRGADVTLVAAHTEAEPPMFVRVLPVGSAQDMFEAVTKEAKTADYIIKAAAVADYTPVATADHKLKKSDQDLTIELKRTKDILKYLGEHKKEGQILCGFAMETEDLLENSRKKLESKNCDLICANSLREEGAGFGTDTNRITLITREKETRLELMTKEQAAHRILDTIRYELTGQ